MEEGEIVAQQAPATINRVFATLRRFTRWANRWENEQPGAVFGAAGLPTRGFKELDVAESECQKLHKEEVQRMFAAADWQVTACTRKNQRPRRNRAILAVLYYTVNPLPAAGQRSTPTAAKPAACTKAPQPTEAAC